MNHIHGHGHEQFDQQEPDDSDDSLNFFSTKEPEIYECLDCKAHFAEPDFLEDGYESYEFWGQRGRHMTYLEVCPDCGSERVQEIG